jgi:hypothetical protein
MCPDNYATWLRESKCAREAVCDPQAPILKLIMKIQIVFAVSFFLTGCADVAVQPVASGTPIKLVYIQRNPAADDIAPDLESAIENGLQRHGIGTKVIDGEPPSENDYWLTYADTGGWDLKPFTKTAELRLKRGAKQVGYVDYISGGGLSTTKFESAREKIDPLMDQLLASIH